MMYIVSKMVCRQRQIPSLYNGIAIENLKDAQEYVEYDIRENLKKKFKVKKQSKKKDGNGYMIVAQFDDNGFAVYKICALVVANKKTEGKSAVKRNSRSKSLDSVEEAVEDARYIADVNDYILTH